MCTSHPFNDSKLWVIGLGVDLCVVSSYLSVIGNPFGKTPRKIYRGVFSGRSDL